LRDHARGRADLQRRAHHDRAAQGFCSHRLIKDGWGFSRRV
jgi:hypothetical protein